MAKLFKTCTTVDPEEIARVLEKGSKILADLAIDQGYNNLYEMRDNKACLRRMLYLYLYAIESWSTCDNATNYMTNRDLIVLLAEVEQLFIVCRTSVNTSI